jgi:hypothetical protein
MSDISRWCAWSYLAEVCVTVSTADWGRQVDDFLWYMGSGILLAGHTRFSQADVSISCVVSGALWLFSWGFTGLFLATKQA